MGTLFEKPDHKWHSDWEIKVFDLEAHHRSGLVFDLLPGRNGAFRPPVGDAQCCRIVDTVAETTSGASYGQEYGYLAPVVATLVVTALPTFGITSPRTGIVLLIVAALLILSIWFPAIRRYFSTTVPLAEAAQMFYQTARKHKSIWAPAAERMPTEKSPAERAVYCAHALQREDVKWYGSSPPSPDIEEIPLNVVKSSSFVAGLDTISTNNHSVIYTNVSVSKKDLKALLKKVKEGAGDI